MADTFDHEIDRFEDTLRSDERFEYQQHRGIDGTDAELSTFNSVVWEVTDFLCSRTGKYDAVKKETDDLVKDGVKVVAGAIAAAFGIVSGGALILIEKILRIVVNIGVTRACASLPLEKPGTR